MLNLKWWSILFLAVLLAACNPSRSLTLPARTSTPARPPVGPLPTPTPLPSTLPVTPASRPVELLTLGKGEIYSCEYSPDGKRLGLVTSLGVYIFNPADMSLLETLPGSTAAFSPDWAYLAIGTGSTVQLLRLADKKVAAQLDAQQANVTSLLFSPDGSQLVSFVRPPGGEVYTTIVDLWRVSDGKLLDTWQAGNILVGSTFSADGGRLFVWSKFDIDVRSWQVQDGRAAVPPISDQNLDALAFSPDGKLLAKALATDSATAGDILIQSTSDVRRVRKLQVSNQPDVGLLQFSPDSSQLSAYFNDGKVRVWRVADGTLLQTFEAAHPFAAFSPDSRTLALPTLDGLGFYDLASGKMVGHLGNFISRPDHAVLSPQGERAAALLNGGLAVWQLPDGEMKLPLPATEAFSLAWSPDGRQLALGGADGKVRLVQADDGSLLRTLPGHTVGVQSVAFSPDGNLLASSSMESIKVWQVSDGMLVRDFQVTGGWVNSLRFSPAGTLLAASSANSGIKVWQLSDGQRVAQIQASVIGDSDVLDFGRNNGFLAVGEESRVTLWHFAEKTPFKVLAHEAGNAQVITIRISPDGSLLVCGLTDGRIEIWQVPEGRLLEMFQAGTSGILSLDFSSDGRTLLSASSDGTIKLWGIH